METADRAIEARRADRCIEAQSLFRRACRLESQAATTLAENQYGELTRSVLFRSAATLALHGELPGYAAYLVARGLEGTPPAEIRHELRELLESIRPEAVSDVAFASGTADGGRLARFLSAYSDLEATLDDLQQALAETKLAAGKLSISLIRRVQQAAHDGLRKYAPNADFSVDLFGLGTDTAETWVSVSWRSDTPPEDWDTAAKVLFEEQGESVLRGHFFATSTQDLADRGVVSSDTAENLLRMGVRGAAAWPIYTLDDEGNRRPGLVLLALTSDHAIFADDLAKRLLRRSVSLLELVIVVGQRDEILARRSAHAHGGTPAD
jgi:hypothetical protein